MRRPSEIELADGFARIEGDPPEAALPFMALGAIVNANNAFLPADFDPTLTTASSTGRTSGWPTRRRSSAT